MPATTDGRNMTGADFALTAGWGHYGSGRAVMPGQDRVEERPSTPAERAALGGATHASPLHSTTTFDIYLNGRAYWRNVPAAVWRYFARPLTPAEVQHFTDTARRIAAILVIRAFLSLHTMLPWLEILRPFVTLKAPLAQGPSHS